MLQWAIKSLLGNVNIPTKYTSQVHLPLLFQLNKFKQNKGTVANAYILHVQNPATSKLFKMKLGKGKQTKINIFLKRSV